MGQNLTRFTIGKVHYNFCFNTFAWKWLTMAPEAHGAQVLPVGWNFVAVMDVALL